jgi:DNA-binding helix-hairpin-helix protein with protein kinase domain
MATSTELLDSKGRPVTLAAELGRGAEGAVYDVREHPGLVAKIYLSPPDKEQAAKLAAMAAGADDRILKLAAWPTDLVLRRGSLAGFLMPRVSGFRPAFELYGPKLRLKQFAKADWRFLIRAASNTARAFRAVHEAGHVIGDVNERNLIVGQDATVRLIDCDSFQVSSGRKTWFCEVGVPTHQPPEMQALSSYAGFTRTPNHDAFGLAVFVFQTLCLGRHPFSGKFMGAGEPPSIDEAIRGFRYAHGGDQRATQMAPPPGSLPMDALTPTLRRMFDAAFLRGGSQGGRPEPAQWVGALDELARQLRQCQASPSHHYVSGLASCPWCEIEARSNTLFFPAVFVTGASGADGFMLLWQQVDAVQVPGPRPPVPPLPEATPSDEARKLGRRLRRASLIALGLMAGGWTVLGRAAGPVAIVLIFALAIVLTAVHATIGRRLRKRRRAATRDWNALRRDWVSAPGSGPAAARSALDRIKADYDGLQADRAAKLRKLHENRRASQMTEYLDGFQIAGAKVKGVGPAKAATLQSYGIETAADVVFARVVTVPGFGPKTTQNLVDWRATLERSFRFDPGRAVAPADVAAVENAAAVQRRLIEQRLTLGLNGLRTAVVQEQAARRELLSRWQAVALEYAQAEADRRAASLFAIG